MHWQWTMLIRMGAYLYGRTASRRANNKETLMDNHAEVEKVLHDIKNDSRVQEMKKYIQHGSVSTYEHCQRVADLSYRINKHLHLGADKESLLKGAMLHDFYLYDWHGYIHADIASKNAKKYLNADQKVQDIIESHMWPLNITRIPKSREAWIVCIADKCVSVRETLHQRKKSKTP